MTDPDRIDPPTALAPDRIADLLAASATAIVAELLALGDESGWRPAPGEWSANECVGHLIESERRGYAGRIRIIRAGAATGRTPELEAWDQSAVAVARRDHLRAGAELAAEFDALRADGVELVRGLRGGDLVRMGKHPHVGLLRVDELLAEWVHHDRNHVRQILANVQAYVWPHMGNAQKFSAP